MEVKTVERKKSSCDIWDDGGKRKRSVPSHLFAMTSVSCEIFSGFFRVFRFRETRKPGNTKPITLLSFAPPPSQCLALCLSTFSSSPLSLKLSSPMSRTGSILGWALQGSSPHCSHSWPSQTPGWAMSQPCRCLDSLSPPPPLLPPPPSLPP